MQIVRYVRTIAGQDDHVGSPVLGYTLIWNGTGYEPAAVPAGPQGPTGPQGLTGPTGSTGPAGQSVTAVTASGLAAGSSPTATYNTGTGALALGIPAGVTGPRPRSR
jgi:hypothetical protein